MEKEEGRMGEIIAGHDWGIIYVCGGDDFEDGAKVKNRQARPICQDDIFCFEPNF